MSTKEDYKEYPVFKGLQRPLEFMGLQGRYIMWAACTVGAVLIGFMIVYMILGFLIALGFSLVSGLFGGGMIFVKQAKGLHTKKNDKGIFIYSKLSSL